MPHFFYLCYSLKPTARDKWLGYISESWRGFLLSIDPKSKAVWSYSFSGHRNGPLGEIFRKGLTESRRQSGAVLFWVIAAGRWRDFSKRIDQKPKAVWSCSFSGRRIGPLGEPRDRCGKAAGGCLAGTSFRGTFPDAGETFCRVLTKSRKLSGAVLFRGTFPKAGVAFRRGSPQSWRRPGLNVFSEHNSEGWWDFSQGIDPKPEAVWREYFFGVHFQRLEWLFAEDLPKAGGGLA